MLDATIDMKREALLTAAFAAADTAAESEALAVKVFSV